jgi:hypothetical protein
MAEITAGISKVWHCVAVLMLSERESAIHFY